LLAALLAGSWPLAAAEPSEQVLKAAFLYNFARYTDWPSLNADFKMCMLGENTLGSALEPIARKEIAGRPIRILKVKPDDPLASCNLLFIADAEHERVADIARTLAGQPVLIVSETGAVDPGLIMLRMNFEQGILVFDANPSVARAAGLTFSAKMLHLARRIF
jgi:hypothetical protein